MRVPSILVACALLACASDARAVGAPVRAKVSPPMSQARAVNLQRLVRMVANHPQSFVARLPAARGMLRLDASNPAHLQALGPLAARISEQDGTREIESVYPAAAAAAAVEISARVEALVAAVETGQARPQEIESELSSLSAYSFYGPQVAQALKSVDAAKRRLKASSDAREIAAGLLAELRRAEPLEDGGAVAAGSGRGASAPRLARADGSARALELARDVPSARVELTSFKVPVTPGALAVRGLERLGKAALLLSPLAAGADLLSRGNVAAAAGALALFVAAGGLMLLVPLLRTGRIVRRQPSLPVRIREEFVENWQDVGWALTGGAAVLTAAVGAVAVPIGGLSVAAMIGIGAVLVGVIAGSILAFSILESVRGREASPRSPWRRLLGVPGLLLAALVGVFVEGIWRDPSFLSSPAMLISVGGALLLMSTVFREARRAPRR